MPIDLTDLGPKKKKKKELDLSDLGPKSQSTDLSDLGPDQTDLSDLGPKKRSSLKDTVKGAGQVLLGRGAPEPVERLAKASTAGSLRTAGEVSKLAGLDPRKPGARFVGEKLEGLAEDVEPEFIEEEDIEAQAFETGKVPTAKILQSLVEKVAARGLSGIAPTEKEILEEAFRTGKVNKFDILRNVLGEIAPIPTNPVEASLFLGAGKAIGLTGGVVAETLGGKFPSLVKPIRNLVKDFVTTKKVKTKITPQMVKDFTVFAEARLPKNAAEALKKMPVDQRARIVRSGVSEFVKTAEPRKVFGKEVTQLTPETLGKEATEYLFKRFPGFSKIVGRKTVPLPKKQTQDLMVRATSKGEEVLLRGGSQFDAEKAVAQEFAKGIKEAKPPIPVSQPKPPTVKPQLPDEVLQKIPQIEAVTESLTKGIEKTIKEAPSFGSPVRAPGGPEALRIPVAPVPGGPVKPLNKIIFDAAKSVGQKIVFGKTEKKFGGQFTPGTSATVVRYAGDLDATAHELAHSLDDRVGLVRDLVKPGGVETNLDPELEKFWVHGSVRQEGPQSSLNYKRSEGMAEFIRAWLVNPDATMAQAPSLTQYFIGKIPEKTLKGLRQFSADIRSFAGATAHEQIMANVQWKPPDSPFIRWFTRGNSVPEKFEITYFDKLEARFVDSLAAFNKAVAFARNEKGLTNVLPKDDPLVLASLYNGTHGKMDQIFDTGMIDSQNKTVTPGGVKWLLETLDSTDEAMLAKEMKEVVSLMISQRTIEKVEKPFKKAVEEIEATTKDRSKVVEKVKKLRQSLESKKLTGVGGGIFSDFSVAKKRIAEMKQNPTKFKAYQEAANRYREWADKTLQYMRDKGRLSKEAYKAITENNEQYVAMQRLIEISPEEEIPATTFGSGSGRSIASVNEPIKKFLGSSRTIQNPYTSLMDSTYKAIKEADRNGVMQSFADLLRPAPGQEGPSPALFEIGRIAKAGDKNTVPVYVNGEKEVWQFEEDVFKSMKGIVFGHEVLPYYMTIPAKIFRSGIVNFPPFMIRNVIRDMSQRVVISETGSGFMDEFTKRGPMDFENLRLFGGDQFGHYLRDQVDYYRAMRTAMKELANQDKTILTDPMRMVRWYDDLTSSSERVGRLAEYKSAYRKAKNELKYDDYNALLFAASKARGLMDFAVAGYTTRTINQVIPFTNAAVQGLRVTYKAGKRDPKGFAARWGIYTVAPAIFTYAWNLARGDIEEYRQLPAWRRDLFYNFKIGPDFWLSIPKAFDIGVLSTGVERALDRAMGNEQAFEGYGGSLARALLPVDESVMAGPFRGWVQLMANFDFFREKTIIPPHEEKLRTDFRDTSKGSRLGQALEKGLGIDARKIDFWLRSQFGFFGSFASQTSDIGREDKRGLTVAATGLLRSGPVYNSQDVRWVYDKAAKNALTTRNEYRLLNGLIKRYFEADTGEEKDKRGAEVRAFAKKIRERWTKSPPPSGFKKIRAKQAELKKKGELDL